MKSNITTLNENDLFGYNAIFEHLPGLVFIKTIDSIYASANAYSAHLYGFNNADHLSGHNDYELKSSIIESADVFRDADKKMISTGKLITYLHIGKYINDETHIFRTKKAPIKNLNGSIIGISCICEEISQPAVGRAIFKLLREGPTKNNASVKLNLIIDDSELHKNLSARETELIFYFTRGFPNKDIGLLMGVSKRTIESYLDSIKYKLQCESRNELLMYCLSYGLSDNVPINILKRYLNKIVPL